MRMLILASILCLVALPAGAHSLDSLQADLKRREPEVAFAQIGRAHV